MRSEAENWSSTHLATRHIGGISRYVVLTFLLSPFAFTVALLPDDAAGWAFIGVTIALPVLYRPFRTKALFGPSVALAVVYALAAVLNSYLFVLPGGAADAQAFIDKGLVHAERGILPDHTGGASVFVAMLSVLFDVAGQSPLAAYGLSALTAYLGVLVFHRLYATLSPSSGMNPIALLTFGLFPSAILFKLAVLREAYEALFFSLVVVCMMGLVVRPTTARVLGFVVFSLLGASLHSALAIFSLGALPLVLLVATSNNQITRGRKTLRVGLAALLFVPLALAGSHFSSVDGRVEAIADEVSTGDRGAALDRLQREGRGGATYAYAPGMAGHPLLRIPAGIVYYWLAPLPWQVRSIWDLLALAENLCRLIMLAWGFNLLRRSEGNRRAKIAVTLGAVLMLETIWSMGTSNWGTALRHHIPAFGALAAVGFVAHRELYARNTVERYRLRTAGTVRR